MNTFKVLAVAALLAAGLTSEKCAEKNTPAATAAETSIQKGKSILDKATGKKWMNLHEKNEGELKAYRPDGFAFPPSRGRSGFKLAPKGVYEEYKPGADDRPSAEKGKWEKAGPDKVTVTLGSQKFTLEFSSISADGMLMIKRVDI